MPLRALYTELTPSELAAWRSHMIRFPAVEVLLPIICSLLAANEKVTPGDFAPGLAAKPKPLQPGTLEIDTMLAWLERNNAGS